METQLEIDQFLMFGLSELCETIEDQELRAYAIAMTIASSGKDIPESWLKIYLTSCAVDKIQMDIHVAVFYGMELLSVYCDCDSDNYHSCLSESFKMHPGYSVGLGYFQSESLEYLQAKDRVDALRNDLLS